MITRSAQQQTSTHARHALSWLEWRQIRRRLPVILGVSVLLPSVFLGAVWASSGGTLGPEACGWKLLRGQPYLVRVTLAEQWFAQFAAMLVPALGAWVGTRVGQDRKFFALAPVSFKLVLGARMWTGLALITMAVATSSAVILLAGFASFTWWPKSTLLALFAASGALLWLRVVMIFALATLLRLMLSPLFAFMIAFGINLLLLFVWQAQSIQNTALFSADPFILQIRAAYEVSAFRAVADSGECAGVQQYVQTHAPLFMSYAPSWSTLGLTALVGTGLFSAAFLYSRLFRREE